MRQCVTKCQWESSLKTPILYYFKMIELVFFLLGLYVNVFWYLLSLLYRLIHIQLFRRWSWYRQKFLLSEARRLANEESFDVRVGIYKKKLEENPNEINY
jgi:hypothetical protein